MSTEGWPFTREDFYDEALTEAESWKFAIRANTKIEAILLGHLPVSHSEAKRVAALTMHGFKYVKAENVKLAKRLNQLQLKYTAIQNRANRLARILKNKTGYTYKSYNDEEEKIAPDTSTSDT